MESAELIFIPGPGMGHLVAAVEMGKLLINRDRTLSITFLIFRLPFNTGVEAYTQSLNTDSGFIASRLRFIHLPPRPQISNPHDQNGSNASSSEASNTKPQHHVSFELINSSQPQVRDAIRRIMRIDNAAVVSPVVCIVVDMFCVSMIDVAGELGLPSYVFFTSSAGFLGLLLHIVDLKDQHNKDITDYHKDSDAELPVPAFNNPVPAKVLPSTMVDKIHGGSEMVLYSGRKILEAKGIMINTFLELEPYAIKSLSDGKKPPVYPIGPLINLPRSDDEQESAVKNDIIMSWLDNQPTSSVVFLCFGSMGWLPEKQLKEIAYALERSGWRFLWSLRRPPPEGSVDAPGEYENPEEVLPEGFVERTSGVGRVIGWAPQVAVLSHRATGGFVSHCGWNSVLESLWFGVAIAAWPSYAEQQMNAFEMVVELGLAVDIRMEYRIEEIVSAEEIERAIRSLMMNGEDGRRRKTEDVQEQSRRAATEGASSFNFLGCLIKDMLAN